MEKHKGGRGRRGGGSVHGGKSRTREGGREENPGTEPLEEKRKSKDDHLS